jgi:hypothetical protein
LALDITPDSDRDYNEATKFASQGKQGIDWKSYDTRHAEFGTIEIGSRGSSLNSGVMYRIVSAKFFRGDCYSGTRCRGLASSRFSLQNDST